MAGDEEHTRRGRDEGVWSVDEKRHFRGSRADRTQSGITARVNESNAAR